jgi:hypothetical protein
MAGTVALIVALTTPAGLGRAAWLQTLKDIRGLPTAENPR